MQMNTNEIKCDNALTLRAFGIYTKNKKGKDVGQFSILSY